MSLYTLRYRELSNFREKVENVSMLFLALYKDNILKSEIFVKKMELELTDFDLAKLKAESENYENVLVLDKCEYSHYFDPQVTIPPYVPIELVDLIGQYEDEEVTNRPSKILMFF